MVSELLKEGMGWIIEKRAKHLQFITVFASHEEKLEKGGPIFFKSCNLAASILTIPAKGT